jgi:hypothetical protein
MYPVCLAVCVRQHGRDLPAACHSHSLNWCTQQVYLCPTTCRCLHPLLPVSTHACPALPLPSPCTPAGECTIQLVGRCGACMPTCHTTSSSQISAASLQPPEYLQPGKAPTPVSCKRARCRGTTAHRPVPHPARRHPALHPALHPARPRAHPQARRPAHPRARRPARHPAHLLAHLLHRRHLPRRLLHPHRPLTLAPMPARACQLVEEVGPQGCRQ